MIYKSGIFRNLDAYLLKNGLKGRIYGEFMRWR